MDRKEIGGKLLKLRGTRPQRQVAAELGISQNALSMYERGERIPRDEIKLKLARYYGTTVQEIFFTQNVHVLCT